MVAKHVCVSCCYGTFILSFIIMKIAEFLSSLSHKELQMPNSKARLHNYIVNGV